MNFRISDRKPVFIVAEVSANHNQDFKIAAALIKKSKECGADAVKFQVYTPDTLTINADNRYFRIKHPQWGGQTLYELYKKAYTPWRWMGRLKRIADDLGIIFFATVFDKTSVDFLEGLRVPAYKIASFELVDLSLIEYAAKTKKALIMSTGMASLPEVKDAVSAAKNGGAKQVILLKCVSSYPARPDEMNLKTILHMKKLFGCPVGLSDHSLGTDVSVAAAVLGARVIEKHFTLSRKIKTPDSFFSIEPAEFKDLVARIRTVENALGEVRYGSTADEKKNKVFRRSLIVVRSIKKGEPLTNENVNSIRPGYGLPPKNLKLVLGKKAAQDVPEGTPLRLDMIRM